MAKKSTLKPSTIQRVPGRASQSPVVFTLRAKERHGLAPRRRRESSEAELPASKGHRLPRSDRDPRGWQCRPPPTRDDFAGPSNQAHQPKEDRAQLASPHDFPSILPPLPPSLESILGISWNSASPRS